MPACPLLSSFLALLFLLLVLIIAALLRCPGILRFGLILALLRPFGIRLVTTCLATRLRTELLAAGPFKPVRVFFPHLSRVDHAVTIFVVISPIVAIIIGLHLA
jgi:hypothetical protein